MAGIRQLADMEILRALRKAPATAESFEQFERCLPA